MEINNSRPARPEGKIVFIRLTPPMYEEVEKLRVRMKGRGVATVIRRIIETALDEGITIREEKRGKGAKEAA
jgi:hypothetical protein